MMQGESVILNATIYDSFARSIFYYRSPNIDVENSTFVRYTINSISGISRDALVFVLRSRNIFCRIWLGAPSSGVKVTFTSRIVKHFCYEPPPTKPLK